ncbi:MAG TPA: hypothetical protein VJJ52_03175 [Candidatus Nanoarchaeia archaeon]|nr:hypothetical protein [Candidatus Nanoarchaeia archaeon]
MFEWQNDEVAALRAFLKVIGNFEPHEKERLEKIFDVEFNKQYELKKASLGVYYIKGASVLADEVHGGIYSLHTVLHQVLLDRKTLERALNEKINDEYMAKLLGEGFGIFFATVEYGLTSNLLVLGRWTSAIFRCISDIAFKLNRINEESAKIIGRRIVKIYDHCKDKDIDKNSREVFEFMIKEFS